MQKITFVLRKINKNCCYQLELHFLTPVCTKSFVDWGFAPDPTGGADCAPPEPITVYRGPTSEGRGKRGSSSFLCPRKKKEKSAPIASASVAVMYRPLSAFKS